MTAGTVVDAGVKLEYMFRFPCSTTLSRYSARTFYIARVVSKPILKLEANAEARFEEWADRVALAVSERVCK